MYVVKYGDEYLHDPRTDDCILQDIELGIELNTCGYCTFSMAPTHPARHLLKERDSRNQVMVYDGDVLLFAGFVWELGQKFELVGEVSCKGELAYLGDSTVRPYSTVAGAAALQAPATVDGYFAWLVGQHNAHVDESKRFEVGVNQGARLDPNNYVLRSSAQMPTTADELQEKLLDSLGGYVFVRHEAGHRYIDYLSECTDVNAQVIDFGVNLTDYTRTDSCSDLYTAIRPTGGTPEGSDEAVTVEGLPDGVYSKDNSYRKDGDVVYDVAAVERYGLIELAWSNDDITLAENLLDSAVIELKGHVEPKTTIEVKAIDLSLFMEGYRPLSVGEFVRVRSKPHAFDGYMLVSKIEPNLNDPTQTVYTLGTTFDSLTGETNKQIKRLNASINGAYDAMAPISAEAKAAAQIAGAAVTDSTDEYALSDSNSDPPTSGWGPETPAWEQGRYIWRRSVTTKGDGTTEVGAPALMTGNAGEDATLVYISSSNGDAFKNSQISTVMRVTVFHGASAISDIGSLRAAYGPSAWIEWSWSRFGEDSFSPISAGDSRIGEGGFTLTVSPADVDTKTVFQANVND